MDPFSISVGIVGLLGACVKVGTELKRFHDDIGAVGDAVGEMRNDLGALVRVLDAMRVTFDGLTETWGHTSNSRGQVVDAHWDNIRLSLHDGKRILAGLQDEVARVNKEVSILGGPRKLVRLRSAEVRIARFRHQVHDFRDTLQISLQALILWNQVSIQSQARPPMVSDVGKIQDDARELAVGLSKRIDSLETLVPDTGDTSLAEIAALNRLQSCARSATAMVPSTPRTLEGGHISDSDSDLDAELALGLYRKARAKFRANDYHAAEALLRNCLARVNTTSPVMHRVLALLCQTCMRLQKWDEAASAIMNKISLASRGAKVRDEASLNDISALVTILCAKKDYVQGHVYARKLLRGYRRLRPVASEGIERTLILLVEICKASGNVDEGEAYATMLEEMLERKAAVNLPATTPTETTKPGALALQGHGTTLSKKSPIRMTATTTPEICPPKLRALGTGLAAPRLPPSGLRALKKLVIVGDAFCGKTCLLYYQANRLEQPDSSTIPVPHALDSLCAVVSLRDITVELVMHDTPGQEDWDRYRPLRYPGSEVVILLFAKDCPDSLENVFEKWQAEIARYLPGVPIVLVGNKKDLEFESGTIADLQTTGQRPVTYEEGAAAATKLGTQGYLECSAKTGEGVREVFNFAARCALGYDKPKSPGLLRRMFTK